MSEFEKKFEKLMPNIRKKVFDALKNMRTDHTYKTIWQPFQSKAISVIKDYLEKEFPGIHIEIPPSKSTYPDIKIIYDDNSYAIDIKSNESGKEPWYDIARLDTIEEERLNKYEEEYDLLIKYNRDSGSVEAVYFEPMYRTVGLYEKCGGVKFRPYDGKLRPKSWEMFETGTSYWETKEDFIRGVEKSRTYRIKHLLEQWWRKLSPKAKKEILSYIEELKRNNACKQTLITSDEQSS